MTRCPKCGEELYEYTIAELSRMQDYNPRPTHKCNNCDIVWSLKRSMKGNILCDLSNPEVVEIVIRADGRVVWINTEKGCAFRTGRINTRLIVDDRRDFLTKGSVEGMK